MNMRMHMRRRKTRASCDEGGTYIHTHIQQHVPPIVGAAIKAVPLLGEKRHNCSPVLALKA